MSLMITPGQLARRAEFYHQLAQLTSAGLGVTRALEQLERHPPALSYRPKINRALRELNHGFTLTEAVRRVGQWLPEFDIALLEAGELSGRLDACFKLLANYYTDRARVARQMIADLAYPTVLLHLAIFIFPFSQFFLSGDWIAYGLKTFGVLIPLYAICAAVIYAGQSRHGERWRSCMESVLRPVPMLGTGRFYLSLARLCAALEALLSAGVTIIQAWEMAATASGSPALRRTVRAWRPQVDAGSTPAEVVSASYRFPELFANQYASGEISGKLEETLGRLRQYYQEEGSRKLHALAQWSPRAVYLFVALMIAYRVVSFYTNYFKQVSNAGGF